MQRPLMLALAACVHAPASEATSWETHARGAANALAAETVSSLVKDNSVVIFSRSSCWTSKRIKSYFEDAGIPYYSLELDERVDGDSLKKALAERTGSSKMPAIYIRGQLVGDGEVKTAFKSGELEHWTL